MSGSDEDIRELNTRTYNLQQQLGEIRTDMTEKIGAIATSQARIESLLVSNIHSQRQFCAERTKDIRELEESVKGHDRELESLRMQTAKDKAECVRTANNICTKMTEALNTHASDEGKHYKSPGEEGMFAYARRRPYISIPAGVGAAGSVGTLIYVIVEYIIPLIIK